MIESTGAYKDKQTPRSWELTETPKYLVIDLFCGAGGVTTGFAEAQLNGNSFVKVIACINHDHKAIKSHWANHPEVIHFEEDIRTLELSGLVETVDYWRSVYPNALVMPQLKNMAPYLVRWYLMNWQTKPLKETKLKA